MSGKGEHRDPTLTKEELLRRLEALKGMDPEVEHQQADGLLLRYLNDAEIADAFSRVERWYA